MIQKHIQPQQLEGKTVDVHTHIGFSLERFTQMGFPYGSTLEDVYYRQKVNAVDYSTVFPLNADTYFDLSQYLETGRLVPAAKPVSPAPYALENRMLLMEVFQFCPELQGHFMPFISVDPGRKVQEQIDLLLALEQEFPIYGMKIVPVAVQSSVSRLLDEGRPFMELAEARNWPVLFHVTVHPDEEYSQISDTFRVIERHPGLRYCLAHSMSFHRGWLERAAQMPNIWFETSGIKILSQLTHELSPVMPDVASRLDCDYSDHLQVAQALAQQFPQMILWGSDTPYHTYIHRRMQGEGKYYEFRLKGTYEEEKAALDVLSDAQRRQINANTIRYLFGA